MIALRAVRRFLRWADRLDDRMSGDVLGALSLFVGFYGGLLIVGVLQ